MDNFIVSARKYRPDIFDTVVGQSAITSTLKNAIKSGHIAQSFLFCGPRGVGKTTCARILAKTINCSNLTENQEACGACESCLSFKNTASHNVYELDAASNRSVDDIKSLIEQVRIPPQIGNYKVYIIDEVHMLTSEAFNAFLKTLEEPPTYAKFILATTEKNKIIPTILSRCQIFDFKRIKIADMADHLANIALKEGIEADKEALHLIAQKADGGLRDALSMFDQIVSFSSLRVEYAQTIEMLNILDYDYYFKLIDQVLAGNVAAVLNIFNEIMENGFDGQHFILGLGNHLRNLLVMQNPATIDLIEVGEGVKEKYALQSRQSSLRFLVNALELQNTCDINYKSSNNKRLTIEILLLQLVGLTSELSTAVVSPPQTSPVSVPPVNPTQTSKPSASDVSSPMPPSSSSSVPPSPLNTASSSSLDAEVPPSVSAGIPSVPLRPETPASVSATSEACASQEVIAPPPVEFPSTTTPPANLAPTSSGLAPESIASQDGKLTERIPQSSSVVVEGESAARNKVYRSAHSIKIPKTTPEQVEIKKNPIIDQDFSQSMLDQAWKDVGEEIQKTQPALYSLMCNYLPVLKQGNIAHLTFATKLQNETFQFCQLDLLSRMRAKLSNSSFCFEIEIEESLITTTLYSPRDKYNKMLENNPALEKFKSELNLDLDF